MGNNIVNKVISLIAIYTILILSVTNLSADQNGNGYIKRERIWPGNGYGNGYGNVYRDTGAPPGTNTPEPISSALFILGGAGLGLYKRFKNKG